MSVNIRLLPIDTLNMRFGVVQMRLDQLTLLLLFTFSHKKRVDLSYPVLSDSKMHAYGVNMGLAFNEGSKFNSKLQDNRSSSSNRALSATDGITGPG